ncbi:hypothetical protein F383_07791 [Gossypium arboreum]|uniref:Uncharacterized protein n=1 Tax=Gossypium arboreum TaxID=29729 RepID=A0A0B0P9W4_GOSAR|nr:hypothetical protein F383_07791 [Gossypium arboreum]
MSGTWHWYRNVIPCKTVSGTWHWHQCETSCKTIAGLSASGTGMYTKLINIEIIINDETSYHQASSGIE